MKKNKDLILIQALRLFNDQGYLNVSIRQIAAATGISHSNLIYHYQTKQDIVTALHNQLLEEAKKLNKETKNPADFVETLYNSTRKGFLILYNYRFLMADLHHILKDNPSLKQLFLEVEKIRAIMYADSIKEAVTQGYLRKEIYDNEYRFFIEHIKIYSDSWITSSLIYEENTEEAIVLKYTDLFVRMFFPYFTEKGRHRFFEYHQRSIT